LPYYLTSTVDTKRNQVYNIGSGIWQRWDLSNLSAGPTQLNPSGCSEIQTQNGPGVDYDSAADKIVGWWSGNNVIVYDPVTNACTTVTYANGPGPNNLVQGGQAPNPSNFGRWRYSARSNVFVLVNGMDQNVYTFRLDNGTPPAPASPDTTSPSALTG